MQHVNEPAPSVRERRPDVPLRLAAAVERALAKEPGGPVRVDGRVRRRARGLRSPSSARSRRRRPTIVIPRAARPRAGAAAARARRRVGAPRPWAPILARARARRGVVAALLVFAGNGGRPGRRRRVAAGRVKLARRRRRTTRRATTARSTPSEVALRDRRQSRRRTGRPRATTTAPAAGRTASGSCSTRGAGRPSRRTIVVTSDTPGFTRRDQRRRRRSRQARPFARASVAGDRARTVEAPRDDRSTLGRWRRTRRYCARLDHGRSRGAARQDAGSAALTRQPSRAWHALETAAQYSSRRARARAARARARSAGRAARRTGCRTPRRASRRRSSP